MGSGGEPRDRVTNAQSPKARRQHERRQLNYEEEQPDRAIVLNALYANADVPAAESGDYGDAVRVSGYDWLALYLEDVTPGGGTAFHVQLQFAHADGQFHDLYEDEAGNGTLVRKVYDTPAGSCCWRVQLPPGALVRAQVWGTGTGVGSRATLKMQRVMWST